jgi:drug/metabolite transporter (DMT)-like permease
MTKDLKGYFFVLLGATFLGSIGVLGRLIYQYEADPIKVVTYRAIIAAILLIGTTALFSPEKLKLKSKDLPFFAIYGFLSVTVTFILFFYAIKYTTVAMATILVYTFPVWVLLLSLFFLNEKLDKGKLLALFLTFFGCILLVQIYNPISLKFNLKGILYSLFCALGAASYTIFGKKATFSYDSRTVVSYALGFGALFLLFIKGPPTLLNPDYPKTAWLWIFALAIIPTILGYSFYTQGLKYLEASRAAIVATWEVVVASFLAFLIFGEKLTLVQILGAVLTFCGIFIIKKKGKEVVDVQK